MRPFSRLLVVAAAAATLAWAPAQGQPRAAGEYEVKAAFLFNFARYVEWPADGFPPEGDPIVVTVLGEDPFGETLDSTLRDRTIQKRPLVVRRVARVEEVGNSQIVFIGKTASEDLPRILQRLDDAPVLTVGETAQFAQRGGMISFRKERDRIGFEINLASTERAHLKVSSQLLKLARIVGQGGKS